MQPCQLKAQQHPKQLAMNPAFYLAYNVQFVVALKKQLWGLRKTGSFTNKNTLNKQGKTAMLCSVFDEFI